jgi:hypothetical protein
MSGNGCLSGPTEFAAAREVGLTPAKNKLEMGNRWRDTPLRILWAGTLTK